VISIGSAVLGRWKLNLFSILNEHQRGCGWRNTTCHDWWGKYIAIQEDKVHTRHYSKNNCMEIGPYPQERLVHNEQRQRHEHIQKKQDTDLPDTPGSGYFAPQAQHMSQGQYALSHIRLTLPMSTRLKMIRNFEHLPPLTADQ